MVELELIKDNKFVFYISLSHSLFNHSQFLIKKLLEIRLDLQLVLPLQKFEDFLANLRVLHQNAIVSELPKI